MADIAYPNEPSDAITLRMRQNDLLPSTPRLRVSLNRAAPLLLNSTWQTIPYVITNTPFDVNTFPDSRYDTTTSTIMPNTSVSSDQAYQLELDFKFQHTKRPLTFQLRFMVPAPTPIYFPLPQTDGYTDLRYIAKTYTGGLVGNLLAVGNLSLTEDTTQMTNRETYIRSIYSALGIKDYGVRVQIRTAENYTGADRAQLIDAVLLMYPVS